MTQTKQDPVDVGTAPAFPPEVAEGSPIGSTETTANGEGEVIGDADTMGTTLKPIC